MAMIGADPEFAIYDPETKEFVPAWWFLPHVSDAITSFLPASRYEHNTYKWYPENVDKNDYLRISQLDDPNYLAARGYKDLSSFIKAQYELTKVFRDGYVMEMNIPPSTCRESTNSYLWNAWRLAAWAIGKFNKENNRKLEYRFVASFPIPVEKVYADEVPDDAAQWGCAPALSAYTGEKVIPQCQPFQLPVRFTGGHMHLSEQKTRLHPAHPFHSKEAMAMYVRLMDKYVGLPITYLLSKYTDEFERRKYYGAAGEYRIQNYGRGEDTDTRIGVEYRVPSSRIFQNYYIMSLAFGIMHEVLVYFQSMCKSYDFGAADAIRHAINTGEGAEDLLKNIEVPAFFNFDILKALTKQPLLTTRCSYPTKPRNGNRDSDYSGYDFGGYGSWVNSLATYSQSKVWSEEAKQFARGVFTGSFRWYNSGLVAA